MKRYNHEFLSLCIELTKPSKHLLFPSTQLVQNAYRDGHLCLPLLLCNLLPFLQHSSSSTVFGIALFWLYKLRNMHHNFLAAWQCIKRWFTSSSFSHTWSFCCTTPFRALVILIVSNMLMCSYPTKIAHLNWCFALPDYLPRPLHNSILPVAQISISRLDGVFRSLWYSHYSFHCIFFL